MGAWRFDAFFWMVFPIVVIEAARITQIQRQRRGRGWAGALTFAGADLLTLVVCAATGSPWLFIAAALGRAVALSLREREWWVRGEPKTALIVAAVALLGTIGGVSDLADVAQADLDGTWRAVVLTLLSVACVIAIVPVQVAQEPKETLAAPLMVIAFGRLAMPVGAAEPRYALIVPIVAVVIAAISALWLLSAGRRANHFEPETLVSELLVCERGVVLAFVWLGLGSGDHLAGVGALLQWWSGVLALLALEAALRRRPLAKPMAFFALGMAVCLPGTVGFVAEDLLAHGLLELRPLLAAAFVGVVALNAAGLYLALVNIIVDTQGRPGYASANEAPPSLTMLLAAGVSLLIGVVPRPFVAEATAAHAALVAHAEDDAPR